WLKCLDRLIEEDFARTLAGHGLSRRHWQVANVLRDRPAGDEAVAEALRPFWSAGAITQEQVLADLAGRGWCARGPDGRHRLTPAGQAGLTTVATQVREVRALVTRGITQEEHRATVETLRRMAGNIESARGPAN